MGQPQPTPNPKGPRELKRWLLTQSDLSESARRRLGTLDPEDMVDGADIRGIAADLEKARQREAARGAQSFAPEVKTSPEEPAPSTEPAGPASESPLPAPETAGAAKAQEILEDIQKLVRLLGPRCVEIRSFHPRPSQRDETRSKLFDLPADEEKLVRYAAAASRAGARAVYFTLNPVDREKFERAVEESRKNNGKAAIHAPGDDHIAKRDLLLIDLDPVRPDVKASSSGAEHEAALAKAREVRQWLKDELGTESLLADSGNGAQLLARIDLPANDGGLVERVLKALSARFSDKRVTIDSRVCNASRICKLYGTVARKGEHTPERPHRTARLLDVPENLTVVSRETLEQIAAGAPTAPAPSNGDHAPVDDPNPEIARWLAEGVDAGRRNDAGSQVVGYIIRRTPERDWETRAWPEAQGWNKLNRPPMDLKELRTIFESVARRERKNHPDVPTLVGRTWDMIRSKPLPPVAYTVKGLFRSREINMIAAAPMTGKSTAALDIALSLSAGEKALALGQFNVSPRIDKDTGIVTPRRVIYLFGEQGQESWEQRLLEIAAFRGFAKDGLPIMLVPGYDWRMDDPKKLQQLIDLVRDFDADDVFLDPLVASSSCPDENDAAEVREHIREPLQRFLSVTNTGKKSTTLYVVHHSALAVKRFEPGSATDLVRGSGDFQAMVGGGILGLWWSGKEQVLKSLAGGRIFPKSFRLKRHIAPAVSRGDQGLTLDGITDLDDRACEPLLYDGEWEVEAREPKRAGWDEVLRVLNTVEEGGIAIGQRGIQTTALKDRAGLKSMPRSSWNDLLDVMEDRGAIVRRKSADNRVKVYLPHFRPRYQNGGAS